MMQGGGGEKGELCLLINVAEDPAGLASSTAPAPGRHSLRAPRHTAAAAHLQGDDVP